MGMTPLQRGRLLYPAPAAGASLPQRDRICAIWINGCKEIVRAKLKVCGTTLAGLKSVQ
jgi:hypothetical protein